MYLVTSTGKDSLFVLQRRYEHTYILWYPHGRGRELGLPRLIRGDAVYRLGGDVLEVYREGHHFTCLRIEATQEEGCTA